MRDNAPLATYSRTKHRALRWPQGGGAISYERGTPVPHTRCVNADLGNHLRSEADRRETNKVVPLLGRGHYQIVLALYVCLYLGFLCCVPCGVLYTPNLTGKWTWVMMSEVFAPGWRGRRSNVWCMGPLSRECGTRKIAEARF